MSEYIFRCTMPGCTNPCGPNEYSVCPTHKAEGWHLCPGIRVQGSKIRCQGLTNLTRDFDGLCATCLVAGRHVCEAPGCSNVLGKDNPHPLCNAHLWSEGLKRPHLIRIQHGWLKKGEEGIEGARHEGGQFVEWVVEGTDTPFFRVGPFEDAEVADKLREAITDPETGEPSTDQEFIRFIGKLLAHGSADAGRWEYGNKPYANDGWGQVWFAEYGDYSGSLVDVSNLNIIQEELTAQWPDDVDLGYGSHGYTYLRVQVTNHELTEKLYELWHDYQQYPLLNEDDFSERETEAKKEYFKEYVYEDLMELAVETEVPELTVPYLDPDGDRAVKALETERTKWLLYLAAEELIEEDGSQGDHGMYLSSDKYGEVIRKAQDLGESGWPSGNTLAEERAHFEHLRRIVHAGMNLRRLGGVQQSMVCLCDGNGHAVDTLDPAFNTAILIACPEHGTRIVVVPLSDLT